VTSSDAVVSEPAAPAQLGLVNQLVRFVGIGVLAAGVDFGVYHLELAFGIWAAVAKGVSFILGTTTAYLLNRRYTFRANGGGATVAKFMLLYGVTFFVNVGVNALALHLLGAWSWRYNVAWVIAQGVATAINFVMLRTVVFRASAE
jgi:putative flippase GtrA